MSQMIESFMHPRPDQAGDPQPLALEELAGTPPEGGPLLASAHPLHALKVRLHVCVGRAEMSLGELLAARRHEVLALDRGLDEPVELMLEGRVVARGQLVAVDGSFGVRITELPLPLGL